MVHMTFQRFSSTIESLPKIKAHLSMVKRTKIVLRTCNLPIYGPPPIGHRNFSRPILSFALFDLIVEFIWTLNVQLSRHWQKYSAVRFPTNKKCPNGWRLMMSLVKCISIGACVWRVCGPKTEDDHRNNGHHRVASLLLWREDIILGIISRRVPTSNLINFNL